MRPAAKQRQVGQVLAEFALCLPIVVMLVFALIDAGRAVFAYNSLARGARVGARYGAVYGGSPYAGTGFWTTAGNAEGTYAASGAFAASTIVKMTAQSVPGLNSSDLQVTIQGLGAPGYVFSQRTPVRVTVSYVFRPVTPFFSNVPLTLSSAGTATIE